MSLDLINVYIYIKGGDKHFLLVAIINDDVHEERDVSETNILVSEGNIKNNN